MLKKFLFFAASLLILTSAIAGTKVAANREKVKVLGVDQSVVMSSEIQVPSQALQKTARVTDALSDGIVLGGTHYDYGWNSGTRRMIVTHNNGVHVHLTWMERWDSLTAPDNRRAQMYGYYDSTSKLLKTFYPQAKSVAQTGFGAVGVFTGGTGDNTGVWVAHTPNRFGIDASPGAGNFTVTNIPTNLNAVDDPNVLVVDKTQTIYEEDTGARTDYQILKSTDFGTTWTLVDSLLKRAPLNATKTMYTIGGLDAPISLAPNGSMAVVTTLSANNGDGALPPTGTANTDSCDLVGAFTSTNGSTWTWTTWGKDGDKVVVGTDTVYVLWENFGQVAGAYDKSSNLHIVANGYSLKRINDTTFQTYFYVLWKKSGQTSWTAISKSADARAFNWDLTTSYKRSGNALGFCYPTLSIDTSSATGAVWAAWSQPRVTAGKVDTNWNGYAKYDIYYNFAGNGSSWGTAQKLANSENGIFTSSAPYLGKIGNLNRAHFVYLADTTGGNYTLANAGAVRGKVNWMYRTVDFVPTSVRTGEVVPNAFSLSQNYPNPFNPATKIQYSVGKNVQVSLKVYNILGQEVATLANGMHEAGQYSADFDASRFASGMYIYKLQAGSFTEVKKMMFVK